jgi:hypothetical protein
MTDLARQIIDALMTTPNMMQALKQDPKAFASRFGFGDSEGLLLAIGQQLLGGLANRLRSAEPAQQVPTSTATSNGRCTIDDGLFQLFNARSSVSGKGACGLSIVGVTSLAAITGALAVLGTVSIVAVSKDANRHSG